MKTGHIITPTLLLFLCILCITPYIYAAQDFFAARDLFNTIACNILCIIEYSILALCAATIVISGARYMSSDDPTTRTNMRKNIEYALAGLILIFGGIPIINAIVSQMKSPFYCVSCSPDAELFRIIAETFSCRIICLVQMIAGTLLAFIIIASGIRYTTSGNNPEARHKALTWIKNAAIGLLVIILAVPVLNYLSEEDGIELSCDCITEVDIKDGVSAIFEAILCTLSLIAPPLCALALTYGGLRYVTSADDPRARHTAKTIIISAFTGMIIVMLAVPLVNTVLTESFDRVPLDCSGGDAMTEITDTLQTFICFILYIAPVVCALMTVYGGIRYLSAGDDPDARKAARTIIISSFIGAILVFIAIPTLNTILAEAFGQVSYECSKSGSVTHVVEIICKLICLMTSIAPAMAALAVIYGGLKYVTSGNDATARNAAKAIITWAIIGLLIVMISLELVNMVVSGWAGNVECNCFAPTEYIPTTPRRG